MRSSITLPALLYMAVSLTSCIGKNKYYDAPVRDEAWVPIYADNGADNPRTISSVPAQKTVAPGKIYVQGNLLFQVDSLAGVHVIDYTDRAHPVKLGFIKCYGCNELAYKNGYLAVNNINDLVFVDIRDPRNVKEVSRVANAFPSFYVVPANSLMGEHPPQRGVYYVCPEFNKGKIVRWELQKNVQNVHCYY